jgi:hypothetical protein
VLVCAAESPLDVDDGPTQLISRWAAAGYSSVVLDLGGRHRQGLLVDATASGWLDTFQAALQALPATIVLDLAGVTSRRSAILAAALAAIRARRHGSGRPHWLVIDPAEPVLADPDLPPEVFDLRRRKYCLVLRDHDWAPPAREPLAARVDVVIPCGPTCPLPAIRR